MMDDGDMDGVTEATDFGLDCREEDEIELEDNV